jgi:hypothetical protein
MAFKVHAGTSWAAGQQSPTLSGVNSHSTISQLALRDQAAGEMLITVRQVDQSMQGFQHTQTCIILVT